MWSLQNASYLWRLLFYGNGAATDVLPKATSAGIIAIRELWTRKRLRWNKEEGITSHVMEKNELCVVSY